MYKPGFEDFLLEIQPERKMEWSESTARIVESIGLPLDQDNQRILAALMAATSNLLTRMLSDYHKWLLNYLEQHSLSLL